MYWTSVQSKDEGCIRECANNIWIDLHSVAYQQFERVSTELFYRLCAKLRGYRMAFKNGKVGINCLAGSINIEKCKYVYVVFMELIMIIFFSRCYRLGRSSEKVYQKY